MDSRTYVGRLKEVLDTFPHEQFSRMMELFVAAPPHKIFVMGNGGSAATASHWTCDINKCCRRGDNRFRMFCLNDNVPSLMAYANDLSFEDVFVEQLKGLLEPGDLVIGISGSGNSMNVVRALEYAKAAGAKTIGIVGFSGGRLAAVVDVAVHIDVNDMQLVEDTHTVMMHMCMKQLLSY
jgi:D-sedoheptulose 7-phosphate isomerase